jgi:mannose-6-phosphate isomerase-like protein (cupin superfamily)
MSTIELKDHGPRPYTVDIEEATVQNANYRTALWTGKNLQVTLMSIPVGGEIGLEVHHELDQFLRLEEGKGRVQMGDAEDDLPFDREIGDDWVVLVPAGTWHNITNVGDESLKIYSIYAPPEHPHGTVHATKAEGDAAEDH